MCPYSSPEVPLIRLPLKELDRVCRWEAHRNRYDCWAYPQPPTPHQRKPLIECRKVSLSNCSQTVGVSENVNRALCFITYFLALEVMPWTIVQLSSRPQMSEGRSSTVRAGSSGLITIVVMTLSSWCCICFKCNQYSCIFIISRFALPYCCALTSLHSFE